jgi:phosphatidate cytidylyltransferase
MLRTRLWMGAVLIGLTVGVLVVDQRLAPWYPFLFLVVCGLSLLACYELLQLLNASSRPPAWLCYGAVAALIAVNWVPAVTPVLVTGLMVDSSPWPWIATVFAAVLLAALLTEMAVFSMHHSSVLRIALTVWVAAYLGLLPCFLVQLRWLPASAETRRATTCLALAIFVPKCCDIGAYFTGRLIGRHRMAPTLSPKKTWEGAVGGLTASALAAVGINQFGPALTRGAWMTAGLGLVLGLAGMLGDLAESLIKRDCGQKDASQIVPGFGGVLDVVDAILFAAPVAYWCLK